MTKCRNLGCNDEATATVPGYPDPIPMCFTHEREYVDRYGPGGVASIVESEPANWWRNGRHSSGDDLATFLDAEYRGTN